MSTSGEVDGTGVTFRLPDRQRRLAAVRLAQEIVPGSVAFDRAAGEWVLRLDRPEVDRMEYLFELVDHNGRAWTITDPGNERTVPGAFGAKSVVEFPGYTPPAWLADERRAGTFSEREFPVLDTTMAVTIWAPDDLAEDEPAPLLAVHDGPEFATLGGFADWLATSDLRARAALLDPGDRNAWYSADDAYAAALVAALDEIGPNTTVVGIGASLGALAMLHAHRRHPGTFGALFLQSGSFFTPDLDPQERDFSGFAAVSDFVAEIVDEADVPTVMTCGTVEENLANNRAIAATLGAPLHETRDAHNFTAWRDALHPHLTDLVRRAA